MGVFRCLSEKRAGFDVEAQGLLMDIQNYLGLKGVTALRIFNRYDVEGITESVYAEARQTVFSEPQVDNCFDENLPDLAAHVFILAVESLPGQFDQRADSCEQCIQLLTQSERVSVKTAKLYVFFGTVDDNDKDLLRKYLINPVESREAELGKPETLKIEYQEPEPVKTLSGFISAGQDELRNYLKEYALAMDYDDLLFMQDYFKTEERSPTVTELKLVDTYWSDHCRHTTFGTHIDKIEIEDREISEAYNRYLAARAEVYGELADTKPVTLMDIATIAAKVLKRRGLLTNIDESEEINACSIHVDVQVDGKREDWLLMFKNETHNHPTEIEPFGGAATCIGGAIRDPLSGRSFVYGAMRVTGSGDPRARAEDTLSGKLPQRKLTVTAAHGYSSYGNQIGLATGYVREIYHPGYIAKRMEIGAVVGAVKSENVVRQSPQPGDKILLLGGRTGRDGIGGATGSSKTHTAQSLVTMASEVQKGNAPEERKIQRLFRDAEVTRLIKRCNDFGAGGVSVAIGELAPGVRVNLSAVRKKYEGLDATELAISESQERMAVVVSPEDAEKLIKKAEGENLEAYVVAEVTEPERLVMWHDGIKVVDLSRAFLDSNGAEKHSEVYVPALPSCVDAEERSEYVLERLKSLACDLRYASQRGLCEMFDDSVGASNILSKFGGLRQTTPIQSMAQLFPVWEGETSTCSVMAFGFDPYISERNPYIGAKSAVTESVSKLVASGCDPSVVYLTFQEYFERLRDDSRRWGKPFSALLGALEAQLELEIAAIGGKDSMSGSFNEIDVPPTLVSFAIALGEAACIISPEFKAHGHDVVLFRAPDSLQDVKQMWSNIYGFIKNKVIISAWAVESGEVLDGIMKMSFGNEIGVTLNESAVSELLSRVNTGSIIAEVTSPVTGAAVIGCTTQERQIRVGDQSVSLHELCESWESVLEEVFPTKTKDEGSVSAVSCADRAVTIAKSSFAEPRVCVLTFPGTNSELDTARAISRAGGVPEVVVVRNLNATMLRESIEDVIDAILRSQIIVIPGGFSGGDEPEGSAKFIAAFFRNSGICDAVHEHLQTRDGLILGICNGFQALIKLGLVPFGKISQMKPEAPTLTHNSLGRHIAKYVYTCVSSVKSPWMLKSEVGEVYAVPVSHGEGRFTGSDAVIAHLVENGQIATQYTDYTGVPSMDISVNPNGSAMAIEGIFSPDGRVFGKMCHTERRAEYVGANIIGQKHQPVFESGIWYYK